MKPMTLEAIGRVFGVQKERIRQIEARALMKLRHDTRAKHLREYYEDAGRMEARPDASSWVSRPRVLDENRGSWVFRLNQQNGSLEHL